MTSLPEKWSDSRMLEARIQYFLHRHDITSMEQLLDHLTEEFLIVNWKLPKNTLHPLCEPSLGRKSLAVILDVCGIQPVPPKPTRTVFVRVNK